MAFQKIKLVIAGVMFGMSMTFAGVFHPSVVIGQMEFKNFDMMRTFVAASIISTKALQLFSQQPCFNLTPPGPSKVFFFHIYAPNIIGGLLTGAGMALSGTCPGSILPQIGLGLVNSWVLFGCIAGGLLYRCFRVFRESAYQKHGRNTQSELNRHQEQISSRMVQMVSQLIDPTPIDSSCMRHLAPGHAEHKLTISQLLGISESIAISSYLKMCSAMLVIVGLPHAIFHGIGIRPYLGGLCIGLCQFSSVLLTGSPLGMSTAWEHFGGLLWWLFALPYHWYNSKHNNERGMSLPRPELDKILVALGVILGSVNLVGFLPRAAADAVLLMTQPELSRQRAFLGGFCLIFGSRFAGGCPSGHGISGMALMSTASFITVGCIFGAGAAVGLVTKSLN